MCLENKSIYEKLAYIHLFDYSMDDLVAKQAEKDEFDQTHEFILVNYLKIFKNWLKYNFFFYLKKTISNTTFSIHQMRVHQTLLKILHISDSYFVEKNNEYVMYYSILQSLVIVICSVFQAYFIKKLFSVKTKYSF